MPLEIATWWYVALSGALFALGTWGLMNRDNAIMVLMSVELMLNAANINFAAFASAHGAQDGFVFALFSIAVAAAEAAVGLAIIVNLFRLRDSVDVTTANLLRG
jgi:NADH-quinone oxidoreductase subunit K